MLITSTDNKLIKHVKKLYNRKYRLENNEFLVETPHLVMEAYQSGVLKEIIALKDTEVTIDIKTTYVTKGIMREITSLDTPNLMVGICEMREHELSGETFLIVDRIQDPGNLGTMIRSAVAFGIDTIVISPDTVDIYNPKVVRATEGMIFQSNFVIQDIAETIKQLKANDIVVIGTNVKAGSSIKDACNLKKYAIIIGNEGSGMNEAYNLLCDYHVCIEMSKNCESLNAGVAASILLYELYTKK